MNKKTKLSKKFLIFLITIATILTIYGSSDKVLNIEKYEKYKPNITNLNEHIIDGGNHANFGSYGIQKCDGESSINPNQQISHTVNLIEEFIFNN